MSNYKVFSNVDGLRDMTDAEKAQHDKDIAKDPSIEERKLNTIREMRNKKLKETDYLALSDTTLSVAMSNYRQGLRDIPQNNTTEEQYDLLLARVDGNLTHVIWNKP